jgi:hypothetical protein
MLRIRYHLSQQNQAVDYPFAALGIKQITEKGQVSILLT